MPPASGSRQHTYRNLGEVKNRALTDRRRAHRHHEPFSFRPADSVFPGLTPAQALAEINLPSRQFGVGLSATTSRGYRTLS
jgi:hypothetical protein